MQFLWPEILTETRGLSLSLQLTGLSVGLLLWWLGWWGHRFWIVLLATAGAGIFGLYAGPMFGTHAVVAGLLLAVAVGALALALVRVVAFAAGGAAVWMAVHSLMPAWEEPFTCFLLGGLAGLFLFRFWTMVLTSFIGTLLMAYFGLPMIERLAKLDVVALSQTRAVLLNWACGGVALFGLLVQFLIERRRLHRGRRRDDLDLEVEDERLPERRPRWNVGRRSYRRAG